MRWRLILEEYGPELLYIKGEENIVADALSRLDLKDDEETPSTPEVMATLFAADDDEVVEFPLMLSKIEEAQKEDKQLQDWMKKTPDKYKTVTRTHSGKDYQIVVTTQDKIVLPKGMRSSAVEWYHAQLCHPGENRTELTMGQHYYWPKMRDTVHHVCSRCKCCQTNKRKLKKYGKLPEKEAETIPWQSVCVDLIGPYKIGKDKVPKYTLHCLTMIDPATGWFEIVPINNKTSMEIANQFEMTWLTRYPWPEMVVCDRGSEFMGDLIDMLKADYGLTRRPITTRNPQANAMVERAHQTIHSMLALTHVHEEENLPEDNPFGGILAAVMFGMRATVHTTTRATPMQLVFNRDAIHNVRFEADWKYIRDRKQRIIRQNNTRENATRTEHHYSVGDKVLVKQSQSRKHGGPLYKGPYSISQVNDNGTVRLKQDTKSGGAIYQEWNIRNVTPYTE